MDGRDVLHEQLESLHAISVEIAAVRDMAEIHDRALGYCLKLTDSKFAFTGLLTDDARSMDVAATKGFQPSPDFYDRFHEMPVRSSVFGITIIEQRPTISNDVAHDPHSVGVPTGHPRVKTFLGVPLRVGSNLIGMIGVANRPSGYASEDERLLQTFANQVAVAIDNARLYQDQQAMIDRLQDLDHRLREAEREKLLARERERIAEGLHDEIGQDIFTIGLALSGLIDDASDPALTTRLNELRRLAIKTAEQVRKVIFALAAPARAHRDLTSSVQRLLSDIETSQRIQTKLVVTGRPVPADPKVDDVAYAVVREALINVGRHARAGSVLVSLRYEADSIDIVVQDDGVGMPDVALPHDCDSYLHFGLRHIRDQVLALEGTFQVANGEEAGAVLKFSLPIPRSE
jgi:signal transduction histidine kinase